MVAEPILPLKICLETPTFPYNTYKPYFTLSILILNQKESNQKNLTESNLGLPIVANTHYVTFGHLSEPKNISAKHMLKIISLIRNRSYPDGPLFFRVLGSTWHRQIHNHRSNGRSAVCSVESNRSQRRTLTSSPHYSSL